METIKYNTTLKCGGCLEKVTPELNVLVGEGNWEVDLQNTPKVLTVNTEVSEQEIKNIFEAKGFQADKM